MGRYKVRAFVIRATRMTESSRVVTLFTEEFGKVKVVAKGADRPKSKFAGTIDLFNLLEAVVYRKETSELGTLSDASVVTGFPRIAADSRKYGFGSAWCEILDKTSHLDHPRPATFRLTEDFFMVLGGLTRDSAGLLFWTALFKMLVFEGYAPEIENCSACGKEVNEAGSVISLKRGGLICKKCSDGDGTLMKLSADSLDLLRKMASENLEDIAGESFNGKAGKKAAEVILAFASYHLGLPRNLKSFKFLDTLTA
jgi:DNA repair protein RecO (recombination protein O)